MFESIAESRLGFWAVALLIVVIDSIVLLKPGEFAFHLVQGRPQLRIPRVPFVVRNREALSTLFSYFARAFFVSSLTTTARHDEDAWKRLTAIDALFQPFSLHAGLSLGLIVLAGPALSWWLGIGLALLTVLPLLYVNALAALAFAVLHRAALGLSPKALGMLALELLLCPVLVANLPKHVIDRTRVVPNTRALAGDDAALEAAITETLENFRMP
jgi:hypothetical protein